MSIIRFISDLHLYDMYSMDWRKVPLDVYANTLVENWNTTVSPEDLTIIVGDIGHYCPKSVNTLKSLNGRKILVLGNHDVEWGNEVYRCGVFSGVHNSVHLSGIDITHIPDESCIKSRYYIHGHHHDYKHYTMLYALKTYARDTYRLNCASDLIGNKPCTLQELVLQKELLLDKMSECL